ncbi:hypothetical protein GCM10028819_46670 [Spirosoma humi]
MKSIFCFWALTILPVGLSIAQNTSTTPTSTTTSGSTNRMQDLYDEHHGINRKKAATTNAPAVSPSEKSAGDQSTRGMSKSSQEAINGSTSRTRIGIRGGVTYPFFTEKAVGIDPALGFVGGLTLNFGTRTVSFQPEVNYSRYSQKATLPGFTVKRATDFLEVPLFLKISSGTYAGNRFFLNVGPYASYVMSASEDGKKISLDGAKGRFGFGAAAGVGAAIKAGPGHVTIEVRGLYSLGDTDNGFNTDSKTILGQGTLGYIFPLGGR